MGRYKATLIIVLAVIGLASTTQSAKAQYVYYPYDYGYVKTHYSTWSAYDMFVSSWGSTGTRSEYFIDSGSRTWRLLDTTYSITPGYSYLGSYYFGSDLRYYKLCGTTYYSVATNCYYYRCKCGRTFYWTP